jgi:LacI family transcriptional regulator
VREHAYCESISAHKLQPVVVPCPAYNVEAGAAGMAELLAGSVAPTAVIAGNDLIAIGALRTIRERGLGCPMDISVVGFNDMPFASELQPPLTTVHVPHHALGTEAARLLLDQLNGGRVTRKTVMLPLHLTVRGSTAPPP